MPRPSSSIIAWAACGRKLCTRGAGIPGPTIVAERDRCGRAAASDCRPPGPDQESAPFYGADPWLAARYQPYWPFDTRSNDSRTSSRSTSMSMSSSFLM